eukprot:1302577-Amphidinium_carterae.1
MLLAVSVSVIGDILAALAQSLRYLGLHSRCLCVSGPQPEADRVGENDERTITTELVEASAPLAITALGTHKCDSLQRASLGWMWARSQLGEEYGGTGPLDFAPRHFAMQVVVPAHLPAELLRLHSEPGWSRSVRRECEGESDLIAGSGAQEADS